MLKKYSLTINIVLFTLVFVFFFWNLSQKVALEKARASIESDKMDSFKQTIIAKRELVEIKEKYTALQIQYDSLKANCNK